MTTFTPGRLITNDTELREHWVGLMGEEDFEKRSLWLIFVEHDQRVAPVVVPIDDIPMDPDDDTLAEVSTFIVRARDELGVASIPMLLSRPGTARMTDTDRRWARALASAFEDQQPQWPIHLATRQRVQVFAPDDLL
ncbi:hypothetical protein [Leekyejoonella antrihumi]|uniref:Uncharacterized protein n=1 Tax=Leekyejoonella antrihumi TaxID=1660198 RepID=A0A563E3N7_9MICO|nr:hypothetical protein [Leekyejoonella antrihumi]TWP36842.1 hypothetical protein FGL98_08795 [Leekyejoonella antrihumi]